MKVTNVSVKLAPLSADRLKAFCTMTVDDEFVVRDLKVIEGTSGLFVAMPSRKLTDHCPTCGGKNHLRAKFCNDCGAKLPENRASDEEAQGKLHADIAHPINAECRNRLQAVILDAFRDELRRAGRDQDARVVDRELGDEPPAEVAPEPPAPSEFEPVAPEPVAPEPVAPEPVAPEPVAPEPVAPEPVAPEPVAPERTSEGSLVPEPTETVPEPATPEPAPPDEPEPDEPEPDEPEPEEPDTGDQGGEEEPGKGHIFGEGIL